MATQIKNGCFALLLLLLWAPFTEQTLHYIESAPLVGGFKPALDTTFYFPDWFEGTYQAQKELFLNDQTGFRPDMVRLNNQINYTFFDKCAENWTVKGKEGYLYQRPYIDAYNGTDYRGYEILRANSYKMKAIQDTLGKLGIVFLVAFLPSKAAQYPEFFPDDRTVAHPGPTNYMVYKQLADSLSITNVDLNAWFKSMKNRSKEPLFTKQGIHWTTWGAYLGGDSLSRFIENKTGKHVPHPDWSQVQHTSKLRNGDDDIAIQCNLIFPVAQEVVAYPTIKPSTGTNCPRPNVIYIGDSYAFKMTEFGLVRYLDSMCEYWGYFDELHDINGHRFAYIREFPWQQEMLHADALVLAYTEFNLTNLGNGFIDNAYRYFYPEKR